VWSKHEDGRNHIAEEEGRKQGSSHGGIDIAARRPVVDRVARSIDCDQVVDRADLSNGVKRR
jgi:hypothetical protein